MMLVRTTRLLFLSSCFTLAAAAASGQYCVAPQPQYHQVECWNDTCSSVAYVYLCSGGLDISLIKCDCFVTPVPCCDAQILTSLPIGCFWYDCAGDCVPPKKELARPAPTRSARSHSSPVLSRTTTRR
jgi:hypothetical protein